MNYHHYTMYRYSPVTGLAKRNPLGAPSGEQMLASRPRLLCIGLLLTICNGSPTVQGERRLSHAGAPLRDGAKYSCGQCCFTVETDFTGTKLEGSTWYAKFIRILDEERNAFLVAGSSLLSDAALSEAAITVVRMALRRPDLISTLIREGVHLAVMAAVEVTTDVPEHAHLDASFWDERARGIGATRSTRTVSCAEENLLCDSSDAYQRYRWGSRYSENICVHELAHSLGGHTLVAPRWLNRTQRLQPKVDAAFDNTVTNDLWNGGYARTNENEYFAEGNVIWPNHGCSVPYCIAVL